MAADEDIPPPDSKLTRSKRSWARVGRFLTGRSSQPETDRLPPGQKLTTGFPVLDLGMQPDIPLAEWSLTVDGLVEKPAVLTWEQLNALPQVTDDFT